MKITKEVIGSMLIRIGHNILDGNSNLTQDEVDQIYENLVDVYVDRTAGAKILGISVSYFDKLSRKDPKFPKSRKRQGFKPEWSSWALQEYNDERNHDGDEHE